MITRNKLVRAAGYTAMLLLSTALFAAAQSNPNLAAQGSGAASRGSAINAQPGGAPSSPPGIASQGGDDTTLEIAPQRQPGLRLPDGDTGEIPSAREFKPGDDTASINRNFRPGGDSNGGGNSHARPYLGITVEYTTQCYLGMEEHGLEVVTIDPNSPAEKSGLKPRGSTGWTAAAATASAILGPLQMLTNPLLAKAAEQQNGDLIVAVDDHRVRSRADLDDEMAKLRPGDTLYLTVIRPMPHGHKTMKIAVKVGAAGEYAQAAPGSAAVPQAQPTY